MNDFLEWSLTARERKDFPYVPMNQFWVCKADLAFIRKSGEYEFYAVSSFGNFLRFGKLSGGSLFLLVPKHQQMVLIKNTKSGFKQLGLWLQ